MKALSRCLVLVACLPTLALAATQNAPRAATLATPQGFRAEFSADLADVQKKMLALAEAIPADKYTWRPAADVRSISEVFMHVAGSNYFLATFVGAEAPPLAGDIEKSVTKKAEVIAELKRSFEHLGVALAGVNDLEARVKMLGSQTTHRGVLLTILNHIHEHLGQLIVYGRMNGVTPPWSK
jgi:uncharacterized damage-inducible protein DinB